MGDRPKFKPKCDVRSLTLTALLGQPPLVVGEDREAFNEFRAHLVKALMPTDAVEELMVGDMVARAWEGAKWRRGRAVFLTAQLQTGLVSTLDASLCRKADGRPPDPDELREMIRKACTGDSEAINQLDQFLAPSNLSFAALADVIQVGDPDVLRVVSEIERQIFLAESRREAAVAELFRYREQKRKYLGEKGNGVRALDQVALTEAGEEPGS